MQKKDIISTLYAFEDSVIPPLHEIIECMYHLLHGRFVNYNSEGGQNP